MRNNFGFNVDEVRLLKKLNSPEKVQRYLNDTPYHLDNKEDVCYSPRLVMREREADCASGAIFAAAVFRFHGVKPLVICLGSVRDDDHLLAIFKKHDHWGAIGKSKYTGLTYREPIHKTKRELALSYFEDYFNYKGEKTLRTYSDTLNLSRFDDKGWMTTEEDISFVPEHFCEVRHTDLLTRQSARNLSLVTPLMLRAGELWMVEKGLLKKAKIVFKG